MDIVVHYSTIAITITSRWAVIIIIISSTISYTTSTITITIIIIIVITITSNRITTLAGLTRRHGALARMERAGASHSCQLPTARPC